MFNNVLHYHKSTVNSSKSLSFTMSETNGCSFFAIYYVNVRKTVSNLAEGV